MMHVHGNYFICDGEEGVGGHWDGEGVSEG